MNIILQKIRQFTYKKPKFVWGFSLVEMIVYVGIFSIILTVIMQLSIQVQFAGIRSTISTEIKENASQAIELITSSVRKGDSLNVSGSAFDQHPGSLVINDSDLVTIDTYTKQVTVGGGPVTIRKLQLTEGLNSPIDITSDHVDVTDYQIINLSHGGQPGVIQVFLELSSINPGNDLNFENQLALRTSIAFRAQP